jgi:hypothetical protein
MTMQQDDVTATTTTDAAIRAMFERRTRQADVEDLRTSILVAIADERQRRGLRALVRRLLPTAPSRVLVLALITTAAVAGGLVVSGVLRVDLDQRGTAASFVRPFDFVIPTVDRLRLRIEGSGMVAWTNGPDLSPTPSPDSVSSGRQPSPSERRGIIVGSADSAWSHGGGGRFMLKTEPHAFLTDLHDNAGVQMSDINEATLGGRPALTVLLSGAGGTDIHVSGGMQGLASGPYALVNLPSRLTVADIDGVTVFVLVWARTADDLDAWLPEADAFIGSFRFHEVGQP